MDRVRFGFDHSVRTNSITVSLATSKVSIQQDSLNLKRTIMRDKTGHEIRAFDLLDQFKKGLQTKPKEAGDGRAENDDPELHDSGGDESGE